MNMATTENPDESGRAPTSGVAPVQRSSRPLLPNAPTFRTACPARIGFQRASSRTSFRPGYRLASHMA
jgi:hypothetical protein